MSGTRAHHAVPEVLGLLGWLPAATVAGAAEMLEFIERHHLMGHGVGYVDVQLPAATRLTADTTLWTGDQRMAGTAWEPGLAADPARIDEPE